MATEKTPPADQADGATTQEPATPEQVAASSEEQFAADFAEFADQDDTQADAAPAEGPEDDGRQPAAETTKDTAPGAASPGADDAASKDKAAAPAAAETPDIWADATPAQRAAFEAAQHENSSHRTRATAQNRKIHELMAAPKPPAAAPAADKDAAKEPDKDWEQFRTEYPEVAEPLEQRLAKLEADNAALRGQVTGITDGQERAAIDTEEALLMQRHPDWQTLTASKDFNEWLPGQPRFVQEGFARNGAAIVDGQEAASLIDLFKGGKAAHEPDPKPSAAGDTPAPKDTGNKGIDSRRQRRLESAVTTQGGQAGPGAGPPEGDFEAAFDHYAKQA